MEDYDELKTFIKIWFTATACLCYCYFIPTRISNSFPRLLALLPVVTAFFILPIPLSTFHLAGPTVFYLVWLGNFKLLLFAFNRGPLASACKLGLVSFVSIALLPINPKHAGNRVDPDPNSVFSCDPIRIKAKHAGNRVSDSDPDPISISDRKPIPIKAKHAGYRVSDPDPNTNPDSDSVLSCNPIRINDRVSDLDPDPNSNLPRKPIPINAKHAGNIVSDPDSDPNSISDHKPIRMNAKHSGNSLSDPDPDPDPNPNPNPDPVSILLRKPIRMNAKQTSDRVSDPDPVSFSSRKPIRINAKHDGNRVSDPDPNSISDHKPNPINHGNSVSNLDSDPDPISVSDFKPNPINAKDAGNRVSDPNLNPYPILDPSHKPILLAIKALILAVIVNTYQYRNNINHNMILALYCCHVYLGVELVLALTAFIVNFILRFDFDIEPQFNEPYLSTSLQDFWGRRWNLMVTRILRPTVYKPVIEILTPVVGKQWGRLFAIFVTFLVSGLMHELIYYYFTRVWPTWEVTWFFVLHGVCVVVEVVVKKVVGGRVRVHRVVSRVVTVAFLTVTGGWLFLPQLLRNGVDVKAINEYTVAVNFLRSKFG